MMIRGSRSLGVLVSLLLAVCAGVSGARAQTVEHGGPGVKTAPQPAGAPGVQAGDTAARTEKPLPAAFRNVFWQPNGLVQGSVAFFTVEMAGPASRVTGKFLGKELTFFEIKGDKPHRWYALAGVDLETPTGTGDLAIAAVVPHKGVVRAVKKVEVGPGNFGAGTVDVPENFVNPNDAEKHQIAADGVWKSRAYAHGTPRPLWSGDFVKPVDAPSTPSFGMTRVLNEERTSEHRGTDFPVKQGAAVAASNAGTVVLARAMFYEGNCVIVDHGLRFFTLYMHLSKMEVKVGEKVKKGQRLGLSGATGRVTGPHLHMGVRWNGAYVDPVRLLTLTLPETEAGKTAAKHPATGRKRRR